MKVLHPKIWVITPKNEGFGFPWYSIYIHYDFGGPNLPAQLMLIMNAIQLLLPEMVPPSTSRQMDIHEFSPSCPSSTMETAKVLSVEERVGGPGSDLAAEDLENDDL